MLGVRVEMGIVYVTWRLGPLAFLVASAKVSTLEALKP